MLPAASLTILEGCKVWGVGGGVVIFQANQVNFFSTPQSQDREEPRNSRSVSSEMIQMAERKKRKVTFIRPYDIHLSLHVLFYFSLYIKPQEVVTSRRGNLRFEPKCS